MRIGFAVPVSGSWATPANMVQVAQRAEALGYHEVWTFQRLLYPQGHAMGPVYRSVHDPVVTLAYLAGVTSRIRLGVAVLNMPFSSPAMLAKQLASLQAVSGGRLDVGLGLGWLPEEFAASGVPFERRGRRGEEFVHVLRRLWSEEVVEHKGEFYELPPVHQDPKPLTPPPILLGGSAEVALRRAGRLADGWISSSREDLDRIERKNLHCKGGGSGRRAGSGGAAFRHPRRHLHPPVRSGRPCPADRLVRGDPAGRGGAGGQGRHRRLPRPQLRPGDRLARRRPRGVDAAGRSGTGCPRALTKRLVV